MFRRLTRSGRFLPFIACGLPVFFLSVFLAVLSWTEVTGPGSFAWQTARATGLFPGGPNTAPFSRALYTFFARLADPAHAVGVLHALSAFLTVIAVLLFYRVVGRLFLTGVAVSRTGVVFDESVMTALFAAKDEDEDWNRPDRSVRMGLVSVSRFSRWIAFLGAAAAASLFALSAPLRLAAGTVNDALVPFLSVLLLLNASVGRSFSPFVRRLFVCTGLFLVGMVCVESPFCCIVFPFLLAFAVINVFLTENRITPSSVLGFIFSAVIGVGIGFIVISGGPGGFDRFLPYAAEQITALRAEFLTAFAPGRALLTAASIVLPSLSVCLLIAFSGQIFGSRSPQILFAVDALLLVIGLYTLVAFISPDPTPFGIFTRSCRLPLFAAASLSLTAAGGFVFAAAQIRASLSDEADMAEFRRSAYTIGLTLASFFVSALSVKVVLGVVQSAASNPREAAFLDSVANRILEQTGPDAKFIVCDKDLFVHVQYHAARTGRAVEIVRAVPHGRRPEEGVSAAGPEVFRAAGCVAVPHGFIYRTAPATYVPSTADMTKLVDENRACLRLLLSVTPPRPVNAVTRFCVLRLKDRLAAAFNDLGVLCASRHPVAAVSFFDTALRLAPGFFPAALNRFAAAEPGATAAPAARLLSMAAGRVPAALSEILDGSECIAGQRLDVFLPHLFGACPPSPARDAIAVACLNAFHPRRIRMRKMIADASDVISHQGSMSDEAIRSRAIRLICEKQPKQAREVLKNLLGNRTPNVRDWMCYASLLSEDGRWSEFDSLVLPRIGLIPQTPETTFCRRFLSGVVQACRPDGDLTAARKNFAGAFTIYPSNTLAAACLIRTDEALKAVETETDARRVLAVQPGNAVALAALGHLAADAAESERLLLRSAESDADVRVFFDLVACARRRGSAEDAEKYLRQAVRADPTDTRAWHALAAVVRTAELKQCAAFIDERNGSN